jgi:hypothetical protein
MKRLFGGLLLAAGILIMLTSGLCTVAVVSMGAFGAVQDPTMLALIYIPLIVGGIPFMIGLGLYRWGRSLLRKPEDHNVF